MNKFTVLYAAMFALILSCGGNEGGKPAEQAGSVPAEEQAIREQFDPVTFDTIIGQWQLMYPESLGYEIQFYKNYRSLIILHLGNHALLFKGVYTIDEEGKVKVNIYEMKRSAAAAAKQSGFTKTQSSYFLFQCYTTGKNQSRRLILKPIKIVIDGNNSDGYFEPVLRLKKR